MFEFLQLGRRQFRLWGWTASLSRSWFQALSGIDDVCCWGIEHVVWSTKNSKWVTNSIAREARIQERAWQLSCEASEEWAVRVCDIEKTYTAISSYFNSFIYLFIYFKKSVCFSNLSILSLWPFPWNPRERSPRNEVERFIAKENIDILICLFTTYNYPKWIEPLCKYIAFVLSVPSENKHNFKKYGHGSIDSLGVPYDYGSIMHYGKRAFAKWPWQTTIRPKKKGVSIGQRKRLSPLDVKQMNLYYNCKK